VIVKRNKFKRRCLVTHPNQLKKIHFWKISSVTLTFELMTFKTYSVHCSTVGNICRRFGWNAFVGSGASNPQT